MAIDRFVVPGPPPTTITLGEPFEAQNLFTVQPAGVLPELWNFNPPSVPIQLSIKDGKVSGFMFTEGSPTVRWLYNSQGQPVDIGIGDTVSHVQRLVPGLIRGVPANTKLHPNYYALYRQDGEITTVFLADSDCSSAEDPPVINIYSFMKGDPYFETVHGAHEPCDPSRD